MTLSPPLRRILASIAVVPFLLAACGGQADQPETPLTDQEFVEVIVALRTAEMELPEGDSADVRFQERRAEILERHGTTPEELREFVRLKAADLPGMTELWDTISTRLRTEAELTEQN
ncbi:MAG TPA: hypothetical protein VK966_08710 [Longimicrobiales bacterium]|nr:hypothetical protein [Longimicrobiales bacterium]